MGNKPGQNVHSEGSQPLLEGWTSSTEMTTFMTNEQILRNEFPTISPAVIASIDRAYPNLDTARSVCQENVAAAQIQRPSPDYDLQREFPDLAPDIVRQNCAMFADVNQARRACQNARIFQLGEQLCREFPQLTKDFLIWIVSTYPDINQCRSTWATWCNYPVRVEIPPAIPTDTEDDALVDLISIHLKEETKQSYQHTLEVVQKLIVNILQQPEEAKFRRIRLANPAIHKAIGQFPIATLLIQEIGFLPTAEDERVLFMEQPNVDMMTRANDVINSLKQKEKKYQEALKKVLPSKRKATPATEKSLKDQMRQINQQKESAYRQAKGQPVRQIAQPAPQQPAAATVVTTYIPLPQVVTLGDFFVDRNIALRVGILTNEFRRGRSKRPVIWKDDIANIALQHSHAMATGQAPISHEGFADRFAAIQCNIVFSVGENICCNNSPDPAKAAMEGWNITPRNSQTLYGEYTAVGVGAVRIENTGQCYIVQIMANLV